MSLVNLPFALVVLVLFPESPRWLLSKAKYKEAQKVLETGSRFNRQPLPKDFDLKAEIMDTKAKIIKEEEKR